MARTFSSLLRRPALLLAGGPLRAARMVACDLDGTLLDRDGVIAPTTAALIRELRDLGLRFVFATARHHYSVQPFCDDLRLDEPVVSLDGALTMLPHGDRPLRSSPLDSTLTEHVLKIQPAHADLSFFVVAPHGIHGDADDDDLPSHYVHWNIERPPLDQTDPATALEVVAAGSFEAINRLYRALATVIDRQSAVDVYESRARRGRWFLALTSARASKRQALAALARSYGIPDRAVIAIGDARNDVEFCRHAGYTVALRNAIDDLKKIADVVTERTCFEHGIDEFLERLVRVRRRVPVAQDEPCQS